MLGHTYKCFVSFCDLLIFHLSGSYLCWGIQEHSLIFGLFFPLAFGEKCWHEHLCGFCVDIAFLCLMTQDWDCWVVWQLHKPVRSSRLSKTVSAFQPMLLAGFFTDILSPVCQLLAFRSSHLVDVTLICISLRKLLGLSIFSWASGVSFEIAHFSIFITVAGLYFSQSLHGPSVKICTWALVCLYGKEQYAVPVQGHLHDSDCIGVCRAPSPLSQSLLLHSAEHWCSPRKQSQCLTRPLLWDSRLRITKIPFLKSYLKQMFWFF